MVVFCTKPWKLDCFVFQKKEKSINWALTYFLSSLEELWKTLHETLISSFLSFLFMLEFRMNFFVCYFDYWMLVIYYPKICVFQIQDKSQKKNSTVRIHHSVWEAIELEQRGSKFKINKIPLWSTTYISNLWSLDKRPNEFTYPQSKMSDEKRMCTSNAQINSLRQK